MYRRILYVASIILLMLIMACGGAARGFLALSVGYEEMITIKRDLVAQGVLDKEGSREITQIMLDGNNVFIELVDTASCLENFTDTNKQQLLRNAEAGLRILERLQASGVLRIKSESAKKSFASKVAIARVTLTGIRAALILIPSAPDGTLPPILSKDQQKALDDFRKTCKQASESFHDSKEKLEADLAELGPINPT